MPDKTVTTERDGRVVWATLANPPRNFMTARMVAELHDLLTEVEEDRSLGSLVLTGGVDGSFLTHYDVADILAGSEGSPPVPAAAAGGALRAVGALTRVPRAEDALRRTPAAGMVELRRIHELFMRMNRLDKVLIAAINGNAMGGGCELALACDVRIMADGEHMIGLPEMSVGLIPGAGGTQRLARTLGPGRALELILEAKGLSPREAADAGLVHRVVAPTDLPGEARATAERLARRSPLSVRMVKRAVYEGASRSLDEGMHLERAAFLAAAASPPAVRAMRAYVDQVERLPAGELSPWSDPDEMRRWQDGTAVDMTTD